MFGAANCWPGGNEDEDIGRFDGLNPLQRRDYDREDALDHLCLRDSMPAVQFHCPHCGGLFQIDESLAGQHVSCPLCAGVVAIPDLSPPAGDYPPPPPSELGPYPPAPEHDEAISLGCPICSGVFQVTRSMGGQQVACPHCSNAVMLPEFEAPPPPGAEPPAGQWSAPPLSPPPSSEHGWGPPAPTPSYTPPAPQEPAETHEPLQPSSDDLPPAAKKRTTAPAREKADDLLPPGAKATRGHPSTPAPAADEDDLLPPGASKKKQAPAAVEKRSKAEELLPPGASKKKSAAVEKKQSKADELLPPAAAKSRETTKKRPAEVEEDSATPAGRPGVAADGSILVPTDDGRYVALREPVKTVGKGDREIELRRLTPDEKAARRFKRSLFLATFGLLFLILSMLVMAYLNGAF
ncbi:MAG: hypothetical protein KY475_09335 [Planctomycetes bacterium]|nr:hypothetical protein [Planctomycetota bacterium]